MPRSRGVRPGRFHKSWSGPSAYFLRTGATIATSIFFISMMNSLPFVEGGLTRAQPTAGRANAMATVFFRNERRTIAADGCEPFLWMSITDLAYFDSLQLLRLFTLPGVRAEVLPHSAYCL